MIKLIDHAEGCIVPVRAQPGARRTGVVGTHGGALKVAVAATPKRGKANAAIIEILSQALGMRRLQIELLSGATSRDKRFLVRGVAKEDIASRLAPLWRG